MFKIVLEKSCYGNYTVKFLLEKFHDENEIARTFAATMSKKLKNCQNMLDGSLALEEGSEGLGKGQTRVKRATDSGDQIRKLIDNCYKTVLETRTDWIALQLVLIYYETTGEDTKNNK